MRHCWGTMTMPDTRYGQDLDRSRNMGTRNRRLGPLVQHPPPISLGGITPQQADNQHTTTRKEAASTSLHKTRDLTHPLRGIAPATRRCTRYVALHPLRGAAPVTWRCTRTEGVQCLQIGCNAYRSGALPPSQLHMRTYPKGRPRTRQAWLGPTAQSKQPPGPDGAVQTAGWARRRSPNSRLGPAAPNSWLGPRAAGPDRPSRRRAERAARGADNEQATERAARGARAA